MSKGGVLPTRWLVAGLAAVLAVAAACIGFVLLVRERSHARQERDQLAEMLRAHCNDFATSLDLLRKDLGRRLQGLKEARSPEEQQRAEAAFDMLGNSIVADMTPPSRRAVAIHWERTFLLCAITRAVPEARQDKATVPFTESARRFAEAQDREVIAVVVSKMAEIAGDVATWPVGAPLRERDAE